ncbi:MAG: porin [Pseudomonadota bacterium]
MKKVLLGTSAIALAGAFAAPASAAEWDVRVGGYMEQFVVYGDSDIDGAAAGTDVDGVDVKSDTEIFFLPSITLDNGLKIGANVQLEGNTSGDQIDESFLFITGSFGRVQLGSENSAGYTMTYSAPDVTFYGVNSGSITNAVPFSGAVGGVAVGGDVFRGTLGSTFIENERNNDAQRITYFTPRFAGFQLGLSYARDGNQDSNGQVDTNAAPNNIVSDIIDIGANYVNSFGGFDVAVSGRWGIASDDRAPVAGTDIGDNPQIWGAGINLGFAGVTIGGSFAEQNNADNEDGRSFDAGISYETGPWGFSFTYFNGENVDEENAAIGGDESMQAFLLGMNYKLAKGVSLGAFGAYVDFEEDFGDGGAGTAGNDVDGFIIGTGIKVSF